MPDQEPDPPLDRNYIDWEIDKILSHHYDPDYEPKDSWRGIPEPQKLAMIYAQTRIGELASDLARDVAKYYVDLSQVPEADQHRHFGDFQSMPNKVHPAPEPPTVDMPEPEI